MPCVAGSLPPGVVLAPLAKHHDSRGSLAELIRKSWAVSVDPLQWNAVWSRAGALRGVHMHAIHTDYLVVLSGRVQVGLSDFRPTADPSARGSCLEMTGEAPEALVIPPGVAHGFFFTEPAVHVYAMDTYWSLDDDVEVHFADPDLGIPWAVNPLHLSARDAEARPLREMRSRIDEKLRDAARSARAEQAPRSATGGSPGGPRAT